MDQLSRTCFIEANPRLLTKMLFDLFFLGFPLITAICLAVIAIRESNIKFWHCTFSLIAYSAFYLAGGREVLGYIVAGSCIAGGWLTLPI
ncbi:MAG: hypothetical protein K2W82_02495 [Candidatus Obscuribacterales bacterium]|nr:hypothetical protein [Candidatus Obscuribacterales bacterium]